jgi:hypothetical protein
MPSAAVSAYGRIQIGRDVLGKREVASVLGCREQAEEKFAHAGRSTASG